MNIDVNFLCKILSNKIWQYTKIIIHHDQVGINFKDARFIQYWTSNSVMHSINMQENKPHMITWNNTENHQFIKETPWSIIIFSLISPF